MNIKNALLWLTGIVLLTLGVFYLGFDEVTAALGKADPLLLAGLLVLQAGTLTLTAYQWHYLLKKSGGVISPGTVLAVNLAGNYVESVTPSVKLGGEAAKVYLFHRHSSLPYSSLAGVLLALKYISLLPFLLLAALFLGVAVLNFQFPRPYIPLTGLMFLVLFVGGVAWMYHRGGKKLETQNQAAFTAAQRSFHGKKTSCKAVTMTEAKAGRLEKNLSCLSKLFLFCYRKGVSLAGFMQKSALHSRSLVTPLERFGLFSISTLIWMLYPVKVYLVVNMLGLTTDLVTVTMVTFTAYLVSMAPLLPGGLGSFEGTMVLMFSLSGFTPAQGLAVALLSRLVTFWFPLLWSALAAAYLALLEGRKLEVKSQRREVS